MISDWWIYLIGFVAQSFFFLRTIVQWFVSEKEGEAVSPTIFWQFSLIGSLLFLVYGALRHDFAIILGQMLVYFIYIRNLQLQNAWKKIPLLLRWTFSLTPVCAIAWALLFNSSYLENLFHHDNIPTTLLIWGSIGQVIFTFRFIYQWIYSETHKQSTLPIGFWIFSLTGSLMILSYGFFRVDPVLIAGQFFGMFTYTRNLMLCFGKKSTRMSNLVSKINLPSKD